MSKKVQKETIFVGDGEELKSLYDRLKRPGKVLGAFCSPDAVMAQTVPCLGEVDDVPAFLEDNPQIRRVYCGTSHIKVDQVRAVQQSCKTRAVRFCAVLPVVNELGESLVTMKVGKQVLLTPRTESLSRLHNLLVKRVFDFVVSLVLLLTLFPVVYLVEYVLVKVRRQGTAIRVQRCTGPNGRTVRRFTFRTPDGESTGIAALPQLMNVFAGRMSLVGPAPIPLSDEDEAASMPKHLERRLVKPGMTGLSQLRGHEGAEALRDDIYYIENWSLWLDLKILLRLS